MTELSTLEPDKALGVDRAEAMLKGIIIPPRPTILVEVLAEQARPEADLNRIAKLISKDVALSAGVLKVVNSPFFSLRTKVTSIYHAVTLLGVTNVVNIITGLMLHSAFADGKGRFMDDFWEHSNQIAMIAALIARKFTVLPPDEAYSIGLFLDCGVPLLIKRFPDYEATYTRAGLQSEVPFTQVEDEAYGTDHAAVGFMVARSWQLPVAFAQCILRHHDALTSISDDQRLGAAQPHLAISMAAQFTARRMAGLPESAEWATQGPAICEYLGIGNPEIDETADEVRSMIEAGTIQ